MCAKLSDLYQKERNYRIRGRILCIIWSLEESISALQIAKRIHRDKQSVRQWIRSYNESGIEGLQSSFNGGFPQF